MDILELQYEILSRLSSQCDRLNLTDFQLETGESAADIEAAARGLWTHEPHFVRAFGENIDFLNITDAGRLELARLKQEREQKANEAQAVANQIAELRRIADAACESAEMAKAKAKKADIKSWVSIGIAFLSLVAELLIHHAELLSLFVQSTT